MIALIILAAGKSQRMGTLNKLAQDLGGKQLLEHAIDAALGSKAGPVILVSGEVQTNHHCAGLEHVLAADAYKGQSHSLRAGIEAVAGRSDVTGALITLADMPFITPDHINMVYEAACQSPERVVRPFSSEKPGHPVYWPRRCFTALQRLKGDDGAQPVLRQAGSQLSRIDIDDDAITFDVDTPEALERARQRLRAIS